MSQILGKSVGSRSRWYKKLIEKLRWFFVAGKDSSWLRFGSKYSTPSWIFASTEFLALAGVDSLVLVSRKKDRGKTRSSSVVVRDFCSPPVRAHRFRTVSPTVHWKLVSDRFLWALVHRQCFSEVFYKCSYALFASVKVESESVPNGGYCLYYPRNLFRNAGSFENRGMFNN